MKFTRSIDRPFTGPVQLHNNKMINDLIIHISGFLDHKNATETLCLNRSLYMKAQNELKNRKIQKLMSFFPHVLRPHISGIERLDIGQRVGRTHYIDFIRREHMSQDIMIGRDVFRRSFISLKHDRGVLTFFQRYTDNMNYYTTGGEYPEGLEGCGGFSLKQTTNDDRVTYLLRRLSSFRFR